MRDINEIINEWYNTIDEIDKDGESEFLNFAQGVDMTETIEVNGIKVIWLANGLYNVARGQAIRETDGDKAKAIITELERYGVEFEKTNRYI